MMVGNFRASLDFDVEELREAVGLNIDGIDKIETTEPTHKCQVCSWPTTIDDHQKHTPNWCKQCEQINTFKRLK